MKKAKDLAREYVNGYTAGGAAFSLVPIPGSTAVGLSLAEAAMIGHIATIYGLKAESIVWSILLKFILLTAGGTLVLKSIAEALNFIPVFGWFAKPLVAGTAIKSIGEGAIQFFENRFPNQEAHKKPSWEAFIMVFSGADVDLDDLRRYWETL